MDRRERQVWGLDFVQDDGGAGWIGGFVRLALLPDDGVAWYWAYLVGPELGLVVVRDHEVPLPRQPGPLVVRADGLWAELVCETKEEHWSIGLEAFGVRLEDPADGFRDEIGERLAVGLDLEWEVEGAVFGEILVGPDRIAFDGTGAFSHGRGDHAWVTTAGVRAELGGDGLPMSVTIRSGRDTAPIEVLGMAAIPISRDGQRPIRLIRVLGRWTDDDGGANVGWVDLVEPS